MKISELIIKLKELKEIHGDVKVVLTAEWGEELVDDAVYVERDRSPWHGIPAKHIRIS